MSDHQNHLARIVDSNTKPWIRLPKSDAFVKIIVIDELNNNILMMIRMAEGASYPNHIHHCIAIAYTLEGEWSYEEGQLSPGVIAYEPDASTHAPIVGKGGATVFVVLDGKGTHYIDFMKSDGTIIQSQTIDYFRALERHAATGEAFPEDFGRPMARAA